MIENTKVKGKQNSLDFAKGELKSAIFIFIFSKVLSKIITYLVFAPVLLLFICIFRGLKMLLGIQEPSTCVPSDCDELNQCTEQDEGDGVVSKEQTAPV